MKNRNRIVIERQQDKVMTIQRRLKMEQKKERQELRRKRRIRENFDKIEE